MDRLFPVRALEFRYLFTGLTAFLISSSLIVFKVFCRSVWGYIQHHLHFFSVYVVNVEPGSLTLFAKGIYCVLTPWELVKGERSSSILTWL